MTRLEIAARILAGWAANPNVRGTNEEAAAGALSLADALLAAAGETPGDQYAAGFRAAVDRAAKVAESVPYVGGVKGDVAWREACDAIRALAPAAPMDFPCCGGSDEDPPQHTQDCSVHPTACLQCRVKAGTVTVARNGRYEQNCPECAAAAPKAAAPAAPLAPVKFTEDGYGLAANGEIATSTPNGWEAELSDHLAVYIALRPGEDAGELTARMLASVGRTP